MKGIIRDYLQVLNVQEKAPDLVYLGELIESHLRKIPFENISKIYYRLTQNVCSIPAFEEYIERIKEYNFGGTCYTLNYYFNLLLKELGFEAILCGADMNEPDVHVVSIVRLKDREYLVDVGYAAPFFEPFPLDLSDSFKIQFGDDIYILHPRDREGRSRLELFRNNILTHSYLVKSYPRDINYFQYVICKSYQTEASFMNHILLTRFSKEDSVIIRDSNITELKGTSADKYSCSSSEELTSAVVNKFNISKVFVVYVLDYLQSRKDSPGTSFTDIYS